VAEVPETKYAQTSGGRVAYQVVGEGPIDVLVVHSAVFPIDLMWEEPMIVRFLDRLSSFSRHIWFDPRGRGASDPLPHVEERFAETTGDDMLALVDHLGCEQVAVLGLGAGQPVLFAASHPERTSALVLVNASARGVPGRYPDGIYPDEVERELSSARDGWGTGAELDVLAPSLAKDGRMRRWLARSQRLLFTPDELGWRARATLEMDLHPALAAVQAPTLVLHRQSAALAGQADSIAELIRGARRQELPGEDFLFFAGDTEPMLDAIEEFLTGRLPEGRSDRVLATVLFTDIVGSTAHTARLGDRRWRDVLAAHHSLMLTEVERFRGRVIKTTGDGVMATFDGPGRAIRCTCATRDALRELGIDIRAGLHTGEVELIGDDIAGMAVAIGARVLAMAGGGEILVSSTVKDLVAGSGIGFEDRGEHELRGVPDRWRLFEVKA
jgi:class 3 adenylate cyclase